jgi:hypothetical protein
VIIPATSACSLNTPYGATLLMSDREGRGEPDAMSVFTHAVKEARELARLLKKDRLALSVPGKVPDGQDGFQQSMQNLEDAILELKTAISTESAPAQWDGTGLLDPSPAK